MPSSEKKCPNCNTILIHEDDFPNISETFTDFYGDMWSDEIHDIAMELCSVCGTLPELLEYVESQLAKNKTTNFKNVLEEFHENLHIPFLLQVAAPIFIYILNHSANKTIKMASVDELGEFGDLDDVGRYVLSHPEDDIKIFGLRALEKIEKHHKKQGKKFNWVEYLDFIINDDLEVIKNINKSLKIKYFLKPKTVEKLKPIIDVKEKKLNKNVM